jgi:hypothetical protein
VQNRYRRSLAFFATLPLVSRQSQSALRVISSKLIGGPFLIVVLLCSRLALSATPTLVQHVSSSANPAGIGISGNNFKFTLPNAVGAGNCLILGMSYPNGNTPTVTDNNGNTWPATPVVSANGGTGNYVASIFVLPNARAGLTSVTVSFGGAILPFNYTISEFNNIDTVSPVSGISSAANAPGPSLTTGSFTPGNNDANGGNLIWNYYGIAAMASNNPTSWIAGGSFTLLDGDIAWKTNQGFPHASQYYVQTAAGVINPSVMAAADTDRFNAVAVALQAATAGMSVPAGIHIDKIIHQTSNLWPTNGNPTLQFPTTGNLRVLEYSAEAIGVTSVTDSDGSTWNHVAGASAPGIWWAGDRPANPNLVVTLHISGGAGVTQSVRFIDVSGAAASPFDVSVSTPDTNVTNMVTVNDAPIITPTTSNGLVIAGVALGQGPGLGLNTGAPSGAIWDFVNYAGETDLDLMENADGMGHVYNTNTSTLDWNWSITSNPNNTGSSLAVAFKSSESSVTNTHDFNADGKSDIVWRDTSGDVAIWLMNGTQVLQTGGVGTAPVAVWSIVGQRDFNGNGMADLLWRDTSGDVAIWFMNGTQVTQSVGVGNVSLAWSVFGTGDFNGDGIGDILWQNTTTGDLAIWLMNGAQVTQAAGIGNAPLGVWKIIGTGDFNGDGKRDILWQDTSGDVAIWFMNGTQVTEAVGVGNASPSVWKIVGTGDFNGDGMADILWQDTSGDVAIWLMNGAQVTQAAGVGNAPPSVWSIVETGDFNGDGKSDILWQDTSGDVSIWFMNGTQVAQTGGVGNIPRSVWTIQNANAE